MSKQQITITNYEEAEKALLDLSKHESFIAKKEAEMNRRIQEVKNKFEQETTDARAQKNLIEQDIHAFCLINKADFLKQRARKLIHGTIGFRTNPPKVTLLNRKYNLKTAIELIKKIFNDKYIRLKEEIDKETILGDYSKEILTDDKLAGVGLKIDQDETFFVEIDWEQLKSEAA